jgi:hypothetical protein
MSFSNDSALMKMVALFLGFSKRHVLVVPDFIFAGKEFEKGEEVILFY